MASRQASSISHLQTIRAEILYHQRPSSTTPTLTILIAITFSSRKSPSTWCAPNAPLPKSQLPLRLQESSGAQISTTALMPPLLLPVRNPIPTRSSPQRTALKRTPPQRSAKPGFPNPSSSAKPPKTLTHRTRLLVGNALKRWREDECCAMGVLTRVMLVRCVGRARMVRESRRQGRAEGVERGRRARSRP